MGAQWRQEPQLIAAGGVLRRPRGVLRGPGRVGYRSEETEEGWAGRFTPATGFFVIKSGGFLMNIGLQNTIPNQKTAAPVRNAVSLVCPRRPPAYHLEEYAFLRRIQMRVRAMEGTH